MSEYIKREDAVKVIKNYGKGAISDGLTTLDPVDDIVALVNAMEWLPTEDVEPVKRGHWIQSPERYWEYTCSNCGAIDLYCSDYYSLHEVTEQQYCPYCGAKMDEVSK